MLCQNKTQVYKNEMCVVYVEYIIYYIFNWKFVINDIG